MRSDRATLAWARHDREWRDPAQVISQWIEADRVSTQMLKGHVSGGWWEVLAAAGITLVISREYEHLLIALAPSGGGPRQDQPLVSVLPMPHPSGLVFDKTRSVLYVASTRNPNQIYDLSPATDGAAGGPLMPLRSRYFPGRLYMHDLALIGGRLYANAVGENAVVRVFEDGRFRRQWWPLCIETDAGPAFGKNYIQLNSIGAGSSLARSYFSASSDRLSQRRPTHKNFPVDGRGVIFSGLSRQVVARGLTRPHSVRLHRGEAWVDNSGYGEFGHLEGGAFRAIARLPGWTRGLCFVGDVAFIGTSRVIPRFRQYAPGLDVNKSVCGVHALDMRSGKILGSVTWSEGNQIFAIEALPSRVSRGFPFVPGRRSRERENSLFYAFTGTRLDRDV